MASVYELSAGTVMNSDPVKVEKGKSLSQVKNLMEEEELRAVPVVDEKNRLEGVISYRELIRFVQFNPSSTGLGKVMHQPPEFESNNSFVDICNLRINSGRKMLVTVDSDNHLEGVIGDPEFLNALNNSEELEQATTRQVGSDTVKMVSENDRLEEARHLMLDNNISRVPVIDDNGKIAGIIRSTDILEMMIPMESQNAGGTSGGRTGSEVNIAGGGEKEEMSDITADQLMQELVLTREDHMKGDEAVQLMQEKDAPEIVFTDNEYPKAIVTIKDFVDFVAELAEQNTVLVNLTGLEVAEEKAVIHNKIKNQLQGSLGRKLRNPEEISLRIKKAEKDGKKHRYEIDLKLYSEFGLVTVNEEGWELMDVLDEALDELNRIIRDKHSKRTEHH